jgi:ABC-type multidrug transport system ATPase subunit
MRNGKLLAFDTPTHLKQDTFGAAAWQVRMADLSQGLGAIEGQPGVRRVGLSGDGIRVITENTVRRDQFGKQLAEVGLQNASFEQVEPSLEDVFLSLAGT